MKLFCFDSYIRFSGGDSDKSFEQNQITQHTETNRHLHLIFFFCYLGLIRHRILDLKLESLNNRC